MQTNYFVGVVSRTGKKMFAVWGGEIGFTFSSIRERAYRLTWEMACQVRDRIAHHFPGIDTFLELADEEEAVRPAA